jgi:arylsulfatase A-like enzyme
MATESLAESASSAPVCSGTSTSVERLRSRDVLALSTWFGLLAGWLEVGTRVLARAFDPTHRLNMMSRHFVWTVPLSNLLLFFMAGLCLAMTTRRFARAGSWLSPRLLCAMALMPALMVATPQVYPWAWLILASGVATWLAPWIERRVSRPRRWLKWSLPALLGLVVVVACLVFGGDWYKHRRESGRPFPAGDPPNVLLVVLDTVRADHLTLYGYPRDTSRSLAAMAKWGIMFTEARATAPWTLASHASMFTGQWPHELGVKWRTPLTGDFPTLAGYLGSRGYATAGFVANTEYCSTDTGLDRGFTHYEDYVADLGHLRPLRFAVLFESAWSAVSRLGQYVSARIATGPIHDRIESALIWLLGSYRKDAAAVNREFLDWLAHRSEPRRPFFAFLNYYDAHAPYVLPVGTPLRFGKGPRTLEDFTLLVQRWKVIDKRRLSPQYRDLIVDSYDNCLGHLDDCLGALLNALARSGELDRTVVIVTADHGEELGDHGLFEHGESLYGPEIRVPLVFVLPSRSQSSSVVRDVVSLRDLPATIVDLVGFSVGSPFSGRSLAGLWRDPSRGSVPGANGLCGAVSELAEPNPTNPSLGLSPAARGALSSLAQGDYLYIRNEGDGTEQLFQEREDPAELVNRAGLEAMAPVLERMRRQLNKLQRASPENPLDP